MNIAICLFGDSAAYKNIGELLNTSNHTYRLFAHAYRAFDSYGFESVLIESPYLIEDDDYHRDLNVSDIPKCNTESNAVHNRPNKHTDITNSMLKVNTLKKQYELHNDMVFDLVVNINFDVECTHQMIHLIEKVDIVNQSNTVFGSYVLGYADYKTPQFNTDFCFGSSVTMDLINNFHRYYSDGKLYQMLKADYYDSAFKNMHYKSLIWKWLAIKNIIPKDIT